MARLAPQTICCAGAHPRLRISRHDGRGGAAPKLLTDRRRPALARLIRLVRPHPAAGAVSSAKHLMRDLAGVFAATAEVAPVAGAQRGSPGYDKIGGDDCDRGAAPANVK